MVSIKELCRAACLIGAFAMPQTFAGNHSVMVSFASLPTDYDFEIDPANGPTYEGSGENDSAQKWTVMYQYLASKEKKVSFLFGGGLEVNTIETGSFTEDQIGIRVEPGVAFNIDPNFRVEAVGSFAVGNADDDSKATDAAYPSSA